MISFRPLTTRDSEQMYAWMLDPSVRINLGLETEPSLEKTERWIANALSANDTIAIAIEYGGTHVGNVILDQISRALGTTRLSIYIETAMQGRGIGRVAVKHALKVAFGHERLNKVCLTVHCENLRAIGVYKSCGFMVEGLHRREFLLEKEIVDCLYMGMLADDVVDNLKKNSIE